MQESSDLLFVYGTLMRGHANPWSRLLWDGAEMLGPARLSGRLFRLGSYPGLVEPTSPDQWVYGELARLQAPRKLLAQLDGYEGPDYRRVLRLVHLTDSGASHEAWVYLYLNAVCDKDQITSGRFQSHP
jgi:gamma-glutamylcyclotransferase (GGCT)/AIG2-like uncharacterized protein YtfP